MNALLPLFAADVGDHKAANLLAAARALTPQLNRSRRLDRKLVANVMTMAFGASDAEGAWLWRDAYDAIEAALVLQIRRLAPQVGRLEDAPAEIVALLANLAELSLTHIHTVKRYHPQHAAVLGADGDPEGRSHG